MVCGVDTQEQEQWTDLRTAAMGAAYSFVKCASANLREKDDTWNVTYAGFASGAMLGLRGVSKSHTSNIRDADIVQREHCQQSWAMAVFFQ